MDDESSNENRIREWRLRRGMTLEGLAQAIGVDPSTLWRMEMGKRGVSTNRLKQIGKALDVPPSELVSKEGAVKLDVIGIISQGAKIKFYGKGEREEALPAGELTEQTVALVIKSNVLPFLEGWLAIYEDIQNPPSPDISGRLCVVKLAGGDAIIKLVKEEAGRYHLFGHNAEPPIYDAVIEWVSPITRLSPPSPGS